VRESVSAARPVRPNEAESSEQLKHAEEAEEGAARVVRGEGVWWRVAEVARGSLPPNLLPGYEIERRDGRRQSAKMKE